MRAAIFDAERDEVSVASLPMPEPAPTELLIKVCRCGICGSDVAMTSASPFKFASGRFGHEYSGEVIGVGREVRSHRPGDRVAVVPVIACGRCENCRFGNPLLCAAQRNAMFGFGEYAVVPAGNAIRLPKTVSFAEGALIEPMACGLHAMRLARVGPGARVLVVGAGSMALSAVFWARALGARSVVVLSRSVHRREAVLAAGADAVLSFESDDLAAITKTLDGPPDIVAECVGKSGMLNLAMQHVRPGGIITAMGLCMHAEPVVPILYNLREVHLLFPFGYTVEEFAATARAFDSGRVPSELLPHEIISLDELPERLVAMRNGGGGVKVHVDLAR